jgi:hypothetical protein
MIGKGAMKSAVAVTRRNPVGEAITRAVTDLLPRRQGVLSFRPSRPQRGPGRSTSPTAHLRALVE